MTKKRDEESGKFTEVVSDDEIISFLKGQNGVSTAEVAEEFDYQRPTAYRRLTKLEDSEKIMSRKVGNSLLWLVDESDE